MSHSIDYYGILQVDQQASLNEIKEAYRHQSKIHHPDVNRARDKTKVMQKVNEAYEVLSDPEKREKYDRKRAAAQRRQAPAEAQAHRARSSAEGQRHNPGRSQYGRYQQSHRARYRHKQPIRLRKWPRWFKRMAVLYCLVGGIALANSFFDLGSPGLPTGSPQPHQGGSGSGLEGRADTSPRPLEDPISQNSTLRSETPLKAEANSRESMREDQADSGRMLGNDSGFNTSLVATERGDIGTNVSTARWDEMPGGNSPTNTNLRRRYINTSNGEAYFTRGSHQNHVVRIQGAPHEISRYPAMGYEEWKYGISTVKISVRTRRVLEWSNRDNKLRVQLNPGANVTGGTYFTRGSHQDDVVRMQGTPDEISRYPAMGYEVWQYGTSTVMISVRTRRVLEWSNRANSLRVRLNPGANVTGGAFFTRDSHQDDVVRVQGTPDEISRHPALGYEDWQYGTSTVKISVRTRRVLEWSNRANNLRVRLNPGANVTGRAFFTRGSHADDVVRIQGAPDKISRYPARGYEVWHYGTSTVMISMRARRVLKWSNRANNVKART